MKLLFIILSIISTINIYIATNLSKKSEYIDNIFYHQEGTVCPFGVYAGQMMILFCFIQCYYIYNNIYEKIKNINIILLFIGIICSFMNMSVLLRIIPAFILQIIIIYKSL